MRLEVFEFGQTVHAIGRQATIQICFLQIRHNQTTNKRIVFDNQHAMASIGGGRGQGN